jgi:hypothetical protein
MKPFSLAAIALTALLFCVRAKAENYAILVGAGHYPYLTHDGKPASDLDGPAPDVALMRSTFINKLHYQPGNIMVLIDTGATRATILGTIRQMGNRIKPGDHLFLYFSGHGTSSLDPNTGGFGMDPATGAIVPSDLRPGSKAQVLSQLIIGKRDLRPELEAIEKKADVVVVFDSCFSGESVKSIGTGEEEKRFLSLSDLTSEEVSSRSLLDAEKRSTTRGTNEAYPYHKIIYFSAASNNEPALDIGRATMARTNAASTIDRQPHGAFSNIFLQAIDQTSTCDQIYEKVRGMIVEQSQKFGISHQHPQLLRPTGFSATGACFPGSNTSAPPTPPAAHSPLRDQLDQVSAGGGKGISCQPDRSAYHNGETTRLSCTASKPGYVTVISYGAGEQSLTVLLPNDYQQDGKIPGGNFQVPPDRSKWEIENSLPPNANTQEQVMLVILTSQPLETRSLGSPANIFRSLNLEQTKELTRGLRNQKVRPRSGGTDSVSYDAVELVFPIVR